jgi:hypothetical protein
MAGRPQCILDKEEIVQQYENNEQAADIGYDYRVTGRTIERRLQSWGIRKRIPKRKAKDDPLGDPDVRIFIGICWDRNLSDEEMQYTLNNNSWKLLLQTIANIRKDIGILRRVSAYQRQEGVSKLWGIIEKELETGTILRYSRGHLYIHFKKIFREFGYQLSQ